MNFILDQFLWFSMGSHFINLSCFYRKFIFQIFLLIFRLLLLYHLLKLLYSQTLHLYLIHAYFKIISSHHLLSSLLITTPIITKIYLRNSLFLSFYTLLLKSHLITPHHYFPIYHHYFSNLTFNYSLNTHHNNHFLSSLFLISLYARVIVLTLISVKSHQINPSTVL